MDSVSMDRVGVLVDHLGTTPRFICPMPFLRKPETGPQRNEEAPGEASSSRMISMKHSARTEMCSPHTNQAGFFPTAINARRVYTNSRPNLCPNV
jgi:hypothetical protein